MMAAERTPVPRSLSATRKVKNGLFTAGMWICSFLALLPLAFIVAFVLARGLKALDLTFFTHTPSAIPGQTGGIVQAFIGTGIIIGLAILFTVPLGVLTAIYLSEYGKGKLASAIRFTAEILLSVPSIVAGAFIWATVVAVMGNFSALAGAVALSVIMWPIITRATEEVLGLVSDELREGALALGLPRWKMILRVVVPTAGAGIFTAIMLAVARGLGETAPLLLTALGNDFVNTNITQPTDAIPLRIYKYIQTGIIAFRPLAWAGAICLLGTVLLLSITARVLSARQQRRMR